MPIWDAFTSTLNFNFCPCWKQWTTANLFVYFLFLRVSIKLVLIENWIILCGSWSVLVLICIVYIAWIATQGNCCWSWNKQFARKRFGKFPHPKKLALSLMISGLSWPVNFSEWCVAVHVNLELSAFFSLVTVEPLYDWVTELPWVFLVEIAKKPLHYHAACPIHSIR